MSDPLIHFAYGPVLLVLIPFIVVVIWYRVVRWRSFVYHYPLAQQVYRYVRRPFPVNRMVTALRIILLLVLTILIAKPQVVHTKTPIYGQGIDIVLVLDVSGSMNAVDDLDHPDRRIDIAKREAIRFVQKRRGDQIGLVLFGRDAVSRCPLTLDTSTLTSVIEQTELGIVDPDGTVLSLGLIIGAHRLKNSTARSKVMILLTDGEPSPYDVSPEQALTLAKELGIKIYTIGIGDEQGGYVQHPLFGLSRQGAQLNKQLLTAIAQHTGGKFFEAKKPQELRTIYDEIDRLEKSDYKTFMSYDYRDFFIPFVWVALACVAAEVFVSSVMWLLL